jgi:unsaturated chondroitin disaccharide hydrolase
MFKISKEDKLWIEESWQKIEEKLSRVAQASGMKIPYTTQGGKYTDKFLEDPTWWTNGFWGGTLMYLYEVTGDVKYLDQANALEEKMDQALWTPEGGIHHDVGFMWYLTSGKNYQLTGNKKSRKRMLLANAILTSRYSVKGHYLVAWNGLDQQGWSIIDSMMNIPLLFFSAQDTGYTRFYDMAVAHADKTLENFIRPDGSVHHIVVYDENTGELIESKGGQGYEIGSSWSRGQSWAINGFAQAYGFTGDLKYLNAAKKVAHYFLTNVSDTYIPALDFRAPKEPAYIDTTAGMIAASGLIDIAKAVPQWEADIYLKGAINLLKAALKKQCDFSENQDNILENSSESYGHGQHMSIIYGDYYLTESIIKLLKVIQGHK